MLDVIFFFFKLENPLSSPRVNELLVERLKLYCVLQANLNLSDLGLMCCGNS